METDVQMLRAKVLNLEGDLSRAQQAVLDLRAARDELEARLQQEGAEREEAERAAKKNFDERESLEIAAREAGLRAERGSRFIWGIIECCRAVLSIKGPAGPTGPFGLKIFHTFCIEIFLAPIEWGLWDFYLDTTAVEYNSLYTRMNYE